MELLAFVCKLTLLVSPVISTVYYVDSSTTNDQKTGVSWTDAFDKLENALTSATTSGDQIWLKGFTTTSTSNYYYPDPTATRSDCFKVSEGVEIYGGFRGNESSVSERETDVTTYKSTISGNLNQNVVNADNCYHVIIFNKQLKLDRVTIRDGYANYIDTYDNLNLDLSTKQANVIHKYGGALINEKQTTDLVINDVVFLNNTAINGGALWFSSSPASAPTYSVQITNSIFQYNKAIMGTYEGGYGGSIYLYHLANINIYNTQFLNNFAAARGGALYQDYSGRLTCDECTFNNNKALGSGGAIFSEDRNSQANAIGVDGTRPEITSSTFTNNYATFYGGAVCLFNGVVATFTNNHFTSNTADQKGGAIALIDSELAVNSNPTYTNNDGVVSDDNIYTEPAYVYDAQWSARTVIDSTTETSYVTSIGNTYATLGSITDIRPWVADTFVCRVDASLAQNGENDGLTWATAYKYIQECIDVLDNDEIGGEIWAKAGNHIPTTIPSWKVGKTAAKFKSFDLKKNIRMYGGFDGTETLRSERDFVNKRTYLTCKMPTRWCSQILTAADDTIVDGFIFKEAGFSPTRRRLVSSITVESVLSATDTSRGAGIYSASTNIVVVNSIFMNLFTDGKGGAVYCIGLDLSGAIKSPTFINVAFVGNTANSRGGGICADANCNFECKHCIFDQNKCAKKGGAVYLDFDSDPVFTDTTFTNNEALESGGCIAADGKSFAKLENPTFKNNKAKYEGGCLYSGSGVDASIEQGFEITKSNGFGVNTESNELINNVPGQKDYYGWPYSSFTMTTDTYEPTADPTAVPTQQPTTATINPTTGSPTSPTKTPTYQNPPNILIFMMDDFKYLDAFTDYAPGTSLHEYNIEYTDIATPNIDRIRNEGIVFTRAYAAGPKCSPSRFGLLTGRYPSRGIWARSRVADTDKYKGVSINVPTTKLDGNDLIYNLPTTLKNNGYHTIHVGKWHISKPDELSCADLDSAADATKYEACLELAKSAGFDCVDAFYYGNIIENEQFSHNPEWMLQSAQNCINNVIAPNPKKPFFLYFSTTLVHTPGVKNALTNFNSKQTPKGELDSEITITGMRTRTQIWDAAVNQASNVAKQETIAATYWIDDTLGAMITYLEDKVILEDTMIIVMGDHGQAKGMLYEQGSRMIQFVRYPGAFGQRTTPFVSTDYIVSNIDIAPTIFQMAGITPDINYQLDGIGWFNNMKLETNDPSYPQINQDGFCCRQRFVEMYNSHALITKNSSYIFRATSEIEGTDTAAGVTAYAAYYQHVYATEQLYHLDTDAGQQTNLIGNNTDPAYFDWIFNNKFDMRNYIRDTAIVSESELDSCLTPEITNIPEWATEIYQPPTPSPVFSGYTCDIAPITWTYLFRPVRRNEFDVNNDGSKREEAETLFMNDESVSCGNNVARLEYIYNFTHVPPQLTFTMIACCNGVDEPELQRHFGNDWLLYNTPGDIQWSNSPALTEALNNSNLPEQIRYNERTRSVTKPKINKNTTSDLIGLKEIISFNIMATMCILCFIGVYCFYRKRKNDKSINELKQLIRKQQKHINEENKNKNIKRSSMITSVELSHNSTRNQRESIVPNKITTDTGAQLFRSPSFSHSGHNSADGSGNNYPTTTKFNRVNTYESDSSVENKQKDIIGFEVVTDPNAPALSD